MKKIDNLLKIIKQLKSFYLEKQQDFKFYNKYLMEKVGYTDREEFRADMLELERLNLIITTNKIDKNGLFYWDIDIVKKEEINKDSLEKKVETYTIKSISLTKDGMEEILLEDGRTKYLDIKKRIRDMSLEERALTVARLKFKTQKLDNQYLEEFCESCVYTVSNEEFLIKQPSQLQQEDKSTPDYWQRVKDWEEKSGFTFLPTKQSITSIPLNLKIDSFKELVMDYVIEEIRGDTQIIATDTQQTQLFKITNINLLNEFKNYSPQEAIDVYSLMADNSNTSEQALKYIINYIKTYCLKYKME